MRQLGLEKRRSAFERLRLSEGFWTLWALFALSSGFGNLKNLNFFAVEQQDLRGCQDGRTAD